MDNRKVIYLDDAIDVLRDGAELLKRVLDDVDVVGHARETYSWGLGVIESFINDINEIPSAHPQYTELTPEEAASEIASGSTMSAWYWLDDMIRLKQMGYAICRKR